MPTIALAVEGGVNFIHIRAPNCSAGEIFEWGTALRSLGGDRAHLVINDRVDIAIVLGARFVQLPEGSLPLAVVRRNFPNLVIGASVHSLEASIAAEQNGADWLLLGNIFATSTHPGRAGVGTQLIQRIRETCGIPIVAIGGIDRDNVSMVRDAGATGVAVISAILSADDPGSEARALYEAIVG